MKWIALILVVAASLNCRTYCREPDSDLVQQGFKAIQQRRLRSAEKILTAALKKLERAHKLTPDLATALNNLGSTYFEDGQYAKAEKLFRLALDVDERTTPTILSHVAADINNVGTSLYQQAKFTAAEEYFKRLVELCNKNRKTIKNPDYATALENYAMLLRQTGRNQEAVSFEQKAKGLSASKK